MNIMISINFKVIFTVCLLAWSTKRLMEPKQLPTFPKSDIKVELKENEITVEHNKEFIVVQFIPTYNISLSEWVRTDPDFLLQNSSISTYKYSFIPQGIFITADGFNYIYTYDQANNQYTETILIQQLLTAFGQAKTYLFEFGVFVLCISYLVQIL